MYQMLKKNYSDTCFNGKEDFNQGCCNIAVGEGDMHNSKNNKDNWGL